jgi:multidrug efflux system outer membrane protein
MLAPIFQGGRLAAEEEAAWADLDQWIALYRQQVITAWQEVADAAVSVQKFGEVAVQEEIQVDAARNAERLARMRYDNGVSNYLEVLDAQRSLFNAELTLAQSNRDQLVALVQLYKALGGGWQEKTAAGAPAQPAPAKAPPPVIPPAGAPASDPAATPSKG